MEASVTASARDQAIAALDDYLRGYTRDDQVASYEEDMFARALRAEAPELSFRAHVQHSLRTMAERGTLDLWLTARDVERVCASGLRVKLYEIDNTADLPQLDLSGDFDILITKVPFDLTGVRRMDAEVFSATGQPLKTMPDIAFDPADGAVFACCEAELARAANAASTVTRVYAIEDSGRRLLAELKLG
jgi:hypothetical protein